MARDYKRCRLTQLLNCSLRQSQWTESDWGAEYHCKLKPLNGILAFEEARIMTLLKQ